MVREKSFPLEIFILMVFATACHVITELNCSNIYASQDVNVGGVTSIVAPGEVEALTVDNLQRKFT